MHWYKGAKRMVSACTRPPQQTLQLIGEKCSDHAGTAVPVGPRTPTRCHSSSDENGESPRQADPPRQADLDAKDLSGRATPVALPNRPAERPPLWHSFPQEAGGPNMIELTQTMQDDAAAQERVVARIGILLDKTIQRNDQRGQTSEMPEFEADTALPVTAATYLSRILKYGGCSPCCAVVGLIYLQRLKQRMPTVCLTSGNIQRLLLTSILVAAKYLEDSHYPHTHWARIGNLRVQELNALELELLFNLNFAVGVTREEYEEYIRALEQ